MRQPHSPFTALVIHVTMVVVLLATLTSSVNAAAGDLDPTFGSPNGFVTTDISGDDVAFAVVVQADGKIVAAGYSSHGGITARDFTLARYTAAGVLDTTFNGTGKVVTNFSLHSREFIEGLALQSTGKIVAVG